MSLPKVVITLGQGGLGSAAVTTDNICGMELTGAANGSVVLGTPFLVTSLQGAIDYGLTLATNPFAYKEVKEFYEAAEGLGVLGVQLYIMVVANTVTVANMGDNSNANSFKKIMDASGGKVCFGGIMYNAADDTLITTTAGIDSLCYTAASNFHAMGNTYASAQKPFRGIVGGTGAGMNTGTGVPGALTASALTDQTSSDLPRVSIVIGNTAADGDACLGLTLGRLAAIPVQRKVSRTRDGALVPTAMYIGTTLVEQYTTTETIHNKAFITLMTHPLQNGYYFSGDQTSTATTSDYHFFARGRVIDKAHRLTYAALFPELDGEVPTEDGGTLNAAYAKSLEQLVRNQIDQGMTRNNEISECIVFVDPAQNVLSTSEIKVVVKIRPVGYASLITVKLGFTV